MQDIERLARSARTAGVTLAVAESLTSGMLADTIGKGEAASEWFAGGVVAYFTRVKEQLLGLEPGTDPCSAACAEQLAAGVRDLLDVDLAVSTTGVGGPSSEGGHDPGTVYLGWATRTETGHVSARYDGDPLDVLEKTVAGALDLIVEIIAERPTGQSGLPPVTGRTAPDVYDPASDAR